ncbi:chain length determinant protein tyrosine kinase EpsG [Povalibacter sp.]|uniref:chain length determinant protein tyrosine kinase EpsG n=1 Tax=Povalibacter sp. TaxID=1962978 RepID=UPI002F429CBC
MAINPVGDSNRSHQPIGELLAQSARLTEHDIKRVLAHQRKRGLRFGEAARSLGLVTAEDIQQALSRQFSYPYIRRGESGLHPMLISAYQPFGPAAEAFRMLRSQLMLRWFDKGRKVLAVGAARTGTGCSTLAANLAVSFAQLGERTLLLDANFRNPAQHQLFGMSAETGLADVLLGRSSVEKSIVSIAQLNGLAVLCAGPIPPNPHELLSSRAMQYLLELASEIYDVVIVDAPPILEYADAQMIASRAGGYVLVTRRHRTRMNDVNAVQERLQPSGATLLGAIVNE